MVYAVNINYITYLSLFLFFAGAVQGSDAKTIIENSNNNLVVELITRHELSAKRNLQAVGCVSKWLHRFVSMLLQERCAELKGYISANIEIERYALLKDEPVVAYVAKENHGFSKLVRLTHYGNAFLVSRFC